MREGFIGQPHLLRLAPARVPGAVERRRKPAASCSAIAVQRAEIVPSRATLGPGVGLAVFAEQTSATATCEQIRSASPQFGSSQNPAAALSQGGIGSRAIPEQSWLHCPSSNGAEMLTRLEPTITTKAPQCRIRKAQLFADLSGCERKRQEKIGGLASATYGLLTGIC